MKWGITTTRKVKSCVVKNSEFTIFNEYVLRCMGRDNVVSIVTRYVLDGPGIECRCRRDFPHPSRPALGRTRLLYNGYQGIPGDKAVGAWR